MLVELEDDTIEMVASLLMTTTMIAMMSLMMMMLMIKGLGPVGGWVEICRLLQTTRKRFRWLASNKWVDARLFRVQCTRSSHGDNGGA